MVASKYHPLNYLLALTALLSFGCKQTNDQLNGEGVRLYNQGNDLDAIKYFSRVIEQNNKLQIAFYNRSLCYSDLKRYALALNDLNQIRALQGDGPQLIFSNLGSRFASEENRDQVPVMTVLFERAKVKFFMDSLKSSFIDFRTCLDNQYEINKSRLWLGTIYIRTGNKAKGCDLYQQAKNFGDDEAGNLIKTNCN
jgi:tetratricopeptide (TPR) repeat protein